MCSHLLVAVLPRGVVLSCSSHTQLAVVELEVILLGVTDGKVAGTKSRDARLMMHVRDIRDQTILNLQGSVLTSEPSPGSLTLIL